MQALRFAGVGLSLIPGAAGGSGSDARGKSGRAYSWASARSPRAQCHPVAPPPRSDPEAQRARRPTPGSNDAPTLRNGALLIITIAYGQLRLSMLLTAESQFSVMDNDKRRHFGDEGGDPPSPPPLILELSSAKGNSNCSGHLSVEVDQRGA